MVKIYAIAAMAENRVIGQGQEIPWKLPEDMRRFARLTRGHAVLMGRRTFESLPARCRPLPGRMNVVATRHPAVLAEYGEAVMSCACPVRFIELAKAGEISMPSHLLWVAGGGEIYRMTFPYWDEVFITWVKGVYAGDTFFPEFESLFRLAWSEEHEEYSFCRYERL